MTSQYVGAPVYPVSFTIPDDGDDNSAVILNTAPEALGNRTEWLRQQVLGSVANNWPYRTEDPRAATISALSKVSCPPCWDPFMKRWIFSGLDTESPTEFSRMFLITDMGNTRAGQPPEDFGDWFTSRSLTPGEVQAIAVNPNTGRVIVLFNSFSWVALPGGNFTTGAAGESGLFNTASLASDFVWLASGTKFILIGGPSDPGGVLPTFTTTTDGTGTFTSVASQIPASLAGDLVWTAACSPTLYVAFSKTATRTHYMTSVDGATFTDRTWAIASGDNVADVIWTGVNWLLSVISGANTKIYSSPDALSWTLISTVVGHTIQTLAACGLVLSGVSNTEPSNINSINYHRMLYSLDGGVTWLLSIFRIRDTVNPDPVYLVSSGSQLVVGAGRCVYGSLVLGATL